MLFLSGGVGGACFERQTLLDLKVEEKKKAMAELEGEAQNHFEGVGAVINNDVSFSDDDDDDEDLGFDDDGEFIDGGKRCRAPLLRKCCLLVYAAEFVSRLLALDPRLRFRPL